ncbi:MAG: type II secretion system protein, partial [Planctomycetota bacterium]
MKIDFVGNRMLRPAPAFTLLELMVVITILSILVAILMPVLPAVRKQAHMTIDMANLRQHGQAVVSRASDTMDHLLGPGGSGAAESELLSRFATPEAETTSWRFTRLGRDAIPTIDLLG